LTRSSSLDCSTRITDDLSSSFFDIFFMARGACTWCATSSTHDFAFLPAAFTRRYLPIGRTCRHDLPIDPLFAIGKVTAMAWEPVLDGSLADEAWAAVRAIGGAIDDVTPGKPLDRVVLAAYLAAALDDDRGYDHAIAGLQECLEQGFATVALYGGLSGAGWVLAHVGDGEDEVLGEIDRVTIALLREHDRWRGDYDLISGLVGIGVYFCERLRSGAAAARVGIAGVVAGLEAAAEIVDHGITWHTPAERLPPWEREEWPEGNYNLGVAHGVPGVIALLGSIASSGDSTAAKARTLSAQATRWLRAQRGPMTPRGCFPAAIGGRPHPHARTSWCYGDLGIAAAGWSCALRTDSDPAEWRELAMACATRPVDLCGVTDPNLCHGASGIAHLCNRFYQASGDPVFRDAARTWFARTLAMRRPGEGIAGFTARRPRVMGTSGDVVDVPAPDLLDGTAGVALALLAGLRDEEPGWDRLLLCDVPPR
jgi:lantibiotic biosynthesis protein